MVKVSTTFAILIVACQAGQGFAATIGASFYNGAGGNGNFTLAPTDSTGVVAQDNWNNLDGNAAGGPTILNDDSGVATTASVTWTTNNGWGGSGAPTADDLLMNGWLDGNSGGPSYSVSVSSIPYTTYDVYVYGTSDTSNIATWGIKINGADFISTGSYDGTRTNQTNFQGTFVDASTATDNPSYFLLTGLTSTSLAIAEAGSGNHRHLSGFQIVESVPVPEPTTLIAVVFGAMSLCMRRGSRAAG